LALGIFITTKKERNPIDEYPIALEIYRLSIGFQTKNLVTVHTNSGLLWTSYTLIEQEVPAVFPHYYKRLYI
jgi:hypothetical protein